MARHGSMKNVQLMKKKYSLDSVKKRDPSERLAALQEKALEVVELGGWKANLAFYNRVAKKLRQVSESSDAKQNQLVNKGCGFPQHWNWQEHLVSF